MEELHLLIVAFFLLPLNAIILIAGAVMTFTLKRKNTETKIFWRFAIVLLLPPLLQIIDFIIDLKLDPINVC